MRKLFSLTIAIAIGFIVTLPALTTQEDAKAIVLDQILVNDLGKANVYLTNQTIVSGTNVAAGAYVLNTPYSTNWVAFIDDSPTFGWTHPCRYVFVDETTGDYQISQAMIYPENMTIFEKISDYIYPSMSEIELPQSQETITYRDRDPHLYAIIINGANANSKSVRFWNNMSAMYCTLRQQGFEDDKIFVHSTDGTAAQNYSSIQRGLDLDQDGIHTVDIDAPATLSAIDGTFQTLQNMNLGQQDKLFIFTTGNGDPGLLTNGAAIPLWDNSYLTSLHLKSILDALPNIGQIMVVMSQSHSGGFITRHDQFISLEDEPFSIVGPNRTIITSVAWDEWARAEMFITLSNEEEQLGTGTCTGLGYDEFVYYWTSAVRGRYPVKVHVQEGDSWVWRNRPWLASYNVGSFPFSTIPGFGPTATYPHPVDMFAPNAINQTNTLWGSYLYANNWDTTTGDQTTTPMPDYWNPCPPITLPGQNYTTLHNHPQYWSNGELIDYFQTLTSCDLNVTQMPSLTLTGNTELYNKTVTCTSTLNVAGNLTLHNSTIDIPTGGHLRVYGHLNDYNSTINNYATMDILGGGIVTLHENSSLYMPNGNGQVNVTGGKLQALSSTVNNAHGIIHLSQSGLVSIEDGSTFTCNNWSTLTGSTSEVWVGEEYGGTGDRVVIDNSIIRLEPGAVVTGTAMWDGIFIKNCGPMSATPSSSYIKCNVSKIRLLSIDNSRIDIFNCIMSQSGQLSATNGSLLIAKYLNYHNNESGIYIEESNITLDLSQIYANSTDGLVINHCYGVTPMISSTNIYNNGGYGVEVRNSLLQMATQIPGSTIHDNQWYGYVNLGVAASSIYNTHITNNGSAEVISLYESFPYFGNAANIPNSSVADDVISTPGSLDRYLLMVLGYEEPPIDVSNLVIDTSDESRFFPNINCFIFGDHNVVESEELYINAFNNIYMKNFETAISELKTIINTYPSTPTAKKALSLIPFVSKCIEGDSQALFDYITAINHEALQNTKLDALSVLKISNKEYTDAIQYLEQIINDPPSDEKKLLAELDQAFCYYKSVVGGTKNIPGNCVYQPKNSNEYSQVRSNIMNELLQMGGNTSSNTNVISILELGNNYPNPFNPTTTIKFSLPKEMPCKLEIYNIKGQRVKSLVNESRAAGDHSVVWNGTDDHGVSVSSGVYFYRLTTSQSTITKKMLMLK